MESVYSNKPPILINQNRMPFCDALPFFEQQNKNKKKSSDAERKEKNKANSHICRIHMIWRPNNGQQKLQYNYILCLRVRVCVRLQ